MESNSTPKVMNREEIIKEVNQFLVEEFEVDQSVIVPEADMRETLQLDSLDFIDLVVVLDNHFHFKPAHEDFDTIFTFQEFYDYVIEKVEAQK